MTCWFGETFQKLLIRGDGSRSINQGRLAKICQLGATELKETDQDGLIEASEHKGRLIKTCELIETDQSGLIEASEHKRGLIEICELLAMDQTLLERTKQDNDD